MIVGVTYTLIKITQDNIPLMNQNHYPLILFVQNMRVYGSYKILSYCKFYILIISKYLLPLTSDVINDGTYREIELGWYYLLVNYCFYFTRI